MTADQPSARFSSLQRYLGEDAGFTRTAADEITIVNFRDDDTKVPFARTDDEFLGLLNAFTEDNKETLGITDQTKIWSQGEYGNVHNWREDKEGVGLLDTGSTGGSPDLRAWLRDRRNAFEALLEKYSGQRLADLERSVREDAAREQASLNAPSPGSTALLRQGEGKTRGYLQIGADRRMRAWTMKQQTAEALLTAHDVARILRVSHRQVAERYVHMRGFPKPIRLPSPKGQGMMRRIASEIAAWIESSRSVA